MLFKPDSGWLSCYSSLNRLRQYFPEKVLEVILKNGEAFDRGNGGNRDLILGEVLPVSVWEKIRREAWPEVSP